MDQASKVITREDRHMKRKTPATKGKTGTKGTTNNSIQKKIPLPSEGRKGQTEEVAQKDFYQSVADILHAAQIGRAHV